MSISRKTFTTLMLVTVLFSSGCATWIDRLADARRGNPNTKMKNKLVLILRDVTAEMIRDHENAVAEVNILRPSEDVTLTAVDAQRFAEAQLSLSETIDVEPGQRLFICLIDREKELVLTDAAEDSRVRFLGVNGYFDLEKAYRIPGLVWAGGEPFQRYLKLKRGHLD